MAEKQNTAKVVPPPSITWLDPETGVPLPPGLTEPITSNNAMANHDRMEAQPPPDFAPPSPDPKGRTGVKGFFGGMGDILKSLPMGAAESMMPLLKLYHDYERMKSDPNMGMASIDPTGIAPMALEANRRLDNNQSVADLYGKATMQAILMALPLGKTALKGMVDPAKLNNTYLGRGANNLETGANAGRGLAESGSWGATVDRILKVVSEQALPEAKAIQQKMLDKFAETKDPKLYPEIDKFNQHIADLEHAKKLLNEKRAVKEESRPLLDSNPLSWIPELGLKPLFKSVVHSFQPDMGVHPGALTTPGRTGMASWLADKPAPYSSSFLDQYTAPPHQAVFPELDVPPENKAYSGPPLGPRPAVRQFGENLPPVEAPTGPSRLDQIRFGPDPLKSPPQIRVNNPLLGEEPPPVSDPNFQFTDQAPQTSPSGYLMYLRDKGLLPRSPELPTLAPFKRSPLIEQDFGDLMRQTAPEVTKSKIAPPPKKVSSPKPSKKPPVSTK